MVRRRLAGARPTQSFPPSAGRFFYNAAHFQVHAATVMGLADFDAVALTSEIRTELSAPGFTYLQTNLAGGLNSSASAYAGFLQHVLRGDFVLSSLLGNSKVCASSACAAGAVHSPAPEDEAWNYSLGHWVEDDPTVGDGAFSSAGALGFYPWIDATSTWYGVIAQARRRRCRDQGGRCH